MAIQKNFIVNRGQSFSEVVVLQKGGSVLNLNNYAVLCVAREGYYHDYYKTICNTQVLDALNGIIRISLDPSDTIGIKVPKLVYALSIKNLNTGNVELIMQGHMIMNQTATWDGDWEEFEESTNQGTNNEISQNTI